MIDKKKGHIKLTDSFDLIPNLKFNLIEGQNLGEVQETRDMNNGWKWLDIKNIHIGDKYFIISLCFKEEELAELSIVLKNNPFDLNPSWNKWSEKREKEKLKEYQGWVTQELGKKRNFKWGDVWTSYDSRGGFSSIGIRYK